MVARLSNGPVSTSALARPFAMALPSFTQHLGVLESCGLVRSKKNGRVRTYELAAKPLKAAEAWMSTRRATWEKRLNQLDAYLMTMKERKS